MTTPKTNPVRPVRAWTPEDDAVLLATGTCTEAAKILGRSKFSCIGRRRRLVGPSYERAAGWTHAEDEILLSSFFIRDVVKLLDRSAAACKRRRGLLAKQGRKPRHIKPLRASRAKSPPVDFLDALKRYERPPTNVHVREGTPILHNPSHWHGSGCGSAADLDAFS